MDDTSIKCAINKTLFVFHPILMKLAEVVVHMGTTTSPSQMKNKKVLIIDRLMEVSSIKVPLRSC